MAHIEGNEVIMLLLDVGIMILMLNRRRDIRRIRGYVTLVVSFTCFFVACIATLAETFFWSDFLNALEHVAYLASTLLFSIWAVALSRFRGDTGNR